MSPALPPSADVIVVGGGNAAVCAALAAAEQGVSVLVLERAPEEEGGGNSTYTAGAMPLRLPRRRRPARADADLTEDERREVDFGTYTDEKFFDDMGRVTDYRSDPDLCEILVTRSIDDPEVDARQGRALPPI